jgi:DNA-binding MarR family transcriptional regulator
MKLSDTQRMILSQASQRDDRLAIPPERLPAAARQTVARSLIKQGLVSDEHASATNAHDAWQIDGRTRLLRITEAGLRAIGVTPEGEAEEVENTRPREERNGVDPRLMDGDDEAADSAAVGDTAPTGGDDAPPQDTPATNAEAALYPARTEDVALLDQALATPRLARTATLREVAQRVLDGWDDKENQRTDLPTAIEALRVALATKPGRPTREAGAPRKPREGTKQEQVLAMLRRPEGATVQQISEATGWAQHTVRGFFAGLKKKGIAVEVLERVRQVGPNRYGAKGSYTIYGIRD